MAVEQLSARAYETEARAAKVEATKELFGDHPEDVLIPMASAAESLLWLEELFNVISEKSLDPRNAHTVKRLADAGAYLAEDVADYVESLHETYRDRLKAAGVVEASDRAEVAA